MSVGKLAHYSIRTRDIEASRRFYTEVLGLREGHRPPFPFPGTWLYAGEDAGGDVVHLIDARPAESRALDAYLGERGGGQGTGRLDHIAFRADGRESLRARWERFGVHYEERLVPELGMHQMFVVDPSGIVVELIFPLPA